MALSDSQEASRLAWIEAQGNTGDGLSVDSEKHEHEPAE